MSQVVIPTHAVLALKRLGVFVSGYVLIWTEIGSTDDASSDNVGIICCLLSQESCSTWERHPNVKLYKGKYVNYLSEKNHQRACD